MMMSKHPTASVRAPRRRDLRAPLRQAAIVVATAVGTFAAVVPVIPPTPVLATSSDTSLQTLVVSPATSVGSPAAPGTTFTYTIGFSCQSTVADTCAGAVIEDVLPTFTDVFGGTAQMTSSGAPSATAGIWASGPSFTGTAPNVKVSGTLNANAQPGQIYSLSFAAVAPVGSFPVGTTQLDDVATATGGQSTPTVSSYVAASAPSWYADKTGPSTLLLGANGTYQVRACPTTTSAALPASFTLVDSLPEGATFVSATSGGQYTGDTPADGTADLVTWTFDGTNRPWPRSGSCVQASVVVRFVENPTVNNLTNVDKTDTVTGTYDSTSLGTDSVTTGLRGPITSVNGSKSVGVGGYYVKTGDAVEWNLTFQNSSEVGATALDTMVAVDDLTGAPDVDLATISVGSWTAGPTAVVETSPDGSVWTALPGGPFTGTNSAVAAPGGTRHVRWTFTGPLPVGFSTSGVKLSGSVSGSGSPARTNTNCLDLTATRDSSTFSDLHSCANVSAELPTPHPRIDKSVTSVTAADSTAHTASTVVPGDTIAYSITLRNDPDATGDLVDPVVTDCAAETDYFLPPVVTVGTNWTQDGAYTDSACTSAGGTPLRFTWSGPAIAPNTTVTVATYTVETTAYGDAEGPTLAGNYDNTATVTKGTGSFDHGTYTDTVTVTVPAYIFLSSKKWVLGAKDEVDGGTVGTGPGPDGSIVAGETAPGGDLRWFLTVQNRGNVPAVDPIYVDVFPFIGDTGVKVIAQNRSSEWAPFLVAPIVAPMGWTVQYSTSTNPCRPEIGPTPSSATPWPTGCQTPNWTTDTSRFALPTYRSIRLSYTGTIPVGATELTFEWEMRAPVYDTSYDPPHASTTDPYERLLACNADPDLVTQDPSTTSPCPRAINSFAWSAEADPNVVAPAFNPGRLSTEPPRAGIQVMAPPAVGNSIGDRVWYDKDYDGIQDAGETGVAGVYVELWREDPDVPANGYARYGYTYTDANGDYLFGLDPDDADFGLPDGNYQVRFFPPPSWYVSPGDADALGSTDLGTPANGGTDSDVSRTPTGTDGGDAYHQTTAVALAGNEHDLTWDMGLWRPEPAIQVVKVTKDTAWADASAGDGVTVLQGRPVTWIYTVTNTGNTRLQNVTLSDDGGPSPTFSVTDCTVQTDGTNADGLHSSATAPMALNRGGVLRCTATGTAGSSTYSNIATTTGVPKRDDGTAVSGAPASVSDTDPSSYLVAKYDLALFKTIGAPNYATGDVTYTITVKNQGTVASGVYDVTDTLPAGTSYVSASPSPSSTSATTVVWSARPTLASNATATITLTVHIDDYLAGPFRNVAEISDDSSELVTTAGVSTPTTDIDSTPDANTGNDMPNPKTYGTIGAAPSGADNSSISQAGVGNDGEDDADIADLVAAPTYDLALIKTVNATGLSAIGDGDIVWTITVKNQGTVPSGAYTVTDTVPAGLAVTTPVPGGGVVTVGSPTRIAWAGTNLAPGDSATFTFTTTISDLTARDFRNVAEVSADAAQSLYGVSDVDSTPDANTGNDMPNPKTYGSIGAAPSGADNTSMSQAGVGNDGEDDADIADLTLPLTGGYDLALAKTVDEAVVTWDDTITYTITVKNQGVLDSREVVVTDHVPVGLTVSDLGGATDHGDGTISWTIDDIPAGDTVTLSFDAVIGDITQRPFRNVAEISDDSAEDYSSAGETITDADSTPDTDVTDDGDYGDIGDGAAIDNVDTGTGPVIPAIDAAGVGADSPGSGGEDDADIADVTVAEIVYDLALVKTGPAVMDPTGSVTFSILVANQGNVPSGAYTVTDTVPAGLTATAASQGGSLAAPTAQVVWTDLPSLAPGATATLTVTMQIVDITKRPYLNVAEITDDSAETYSVPTVDEVADADSVPGDAASSSSDSLVLADAGVGADAGYDDEDVASITTDPVYDLALVKVADRATTTYDGQVVWTLTIANQGNVPSGGYAVTDTLPVGMSVVSASDGGTVAGDGRSVVWALPSLLPGGTATVTLTTRVTDVTKRPFRNAAEITADGAAAYTVPAGTTIRDVDSLPGDAATSPVDVTTMEQSGAGGDAGYDDEDIAVVDVPVVYDLDLVKRLADGQSFKRGSVIRYEITVSNQGNVPSGPYTVVDDLPTGLTFVDASHGGVVTGQRVTWTDLTSLLPGERAVVTVEARLDDLTQTSYVNVASIAKDGSTLVSTPNDPVEDVDSHPALPASGTTAIEDDEGTAALSMAQVASDNSVPTSLPRTGTDAQPVVRWATAAVAGGAALIATSWRRRRRRAAT